MSDKQILEWQEKVRSTFGDEGELYKYLFETMDNFYYRYLETTVDQNLKTMKLADHIWGARSREPSMVDALKVTNPEAKKGIIEMAKAYPKSQSPEVRYELSANVEKLTVDQGKLTLSSVINWGFPDFNDSSKVYSKKIVFIYDDLGQFRKELALKLEEVCEGFL